MEGWVGGWVAEERGRKSEGERRRALKGWRVWDDEKAQKEGLDSKRARGGEEWVEVVLTHTLHPPTPHLHAGTLAFLICPSIPPISQLPNCPLWRVLGRNWGGGNGEGWEVGRL